MLINYYKSGGGGGGSSGGGSDVNCGYEYGDYDCCFVSLYRFILFFTSILLLHLHFFFIIASFIIFIFP